MTTRPAHRAPGSPLRTRSARLVAGTMAAGLTAGLIVASGGTADAATTYSTGAAGRFLSGTIANTSLDTVAGIEGETAKNNYGPTVTNKNSLNAELLNGAVKIPLQNGLQLPGLNVLQLGAVAQYASASPDGSALGASGAVDSNGGIGAGGSNGAPTGGATLDLSGLGGSALSSLLNVKATIGAVSARAIQAPATGSTVAKNACTGSSKTIKDGAQLGQYCVAGLKLELDLPVLKNLLSTVLGPVTTLLDSVSTTLGKTGLVTIPSLTKAIASLTTLSLPASGAGAGAIVLDLNTGTISVDVAKLLQSLGLDLNNLPPNTSLVPYIVKALAGLPAALGNLAQDVVDKVNDVVGGIKVAGLSADALKLILDPLLKSLTGSDGLLATLTSTLTSVVGQLTPITDLLSKLLEIIVNGQTEADGIFTETSLALNIGSGTGLDLSSITSVLSGLGLGGVIPASDLPAVRRRVATAESNVKSAYQRETGKSTSKPSATKTTSSAKTVKLATFDAAILPATLPKIAPSTRFLAAAVSNPIVGLYLAQAAVGPSTPRTTTTTPTPTPTTSVPTTQVPTGVPAGQAGGKGNSPELPLVLVLITLVLAGGGVATYRFRGARTQQH